MKKLLLLIVIYPLVAFLSLRVGAVVTGLPSVASFFGGADPLVVVATIAAGFALASFLLGTITGDFSWVDRLWSTAPVLFVWVYVVRSGFAWSLVLAGVLAALWGARLTFNFARRGGYTTIEDYRWPILRSRMGNGFRWQLFNLFFISGYQIALFILFTMPAYRLYNALASGAVADGPNGGSLVVAALLIVALVYETTADQQQWLFQNIKHGAFTDRRAPAWFGGERTRQVALDEDIRAGFLTHGLFRLSRHPNYFGELAVWWMFFLYTSFVTQSLYHWSCLGAALLTLLFVGSTGFTESISSSKYPAYAEYRRRTSAIIPWIPSASGEEQVD